METVRKSAIELGDVAALSNCDEGTTVESDTSTQVRQNQNVYGKRFDRYSSLFSSYMSSVILTGLRNFRNINILNFDEPPSFKMVLYPLL